jgi:uncharacterized protein (TIGR03437 family)
MNIMKLGVAGWLVAGLVIPGVAQSLPEIKSAGYTVPPRPRFAPGQVITLFVPGLNSPSGRCADSINASTLPLPTNLDGVVVTAVETSRSGGFSADLPILGITNLICFGGVYAESPNLTAVTVQMPAVQFCPPEASPNPCLYVPVVSVTVKKGANPVASSQMIAVGTSAHILNSCDTSVLPFLTDAVRIGQLMGGCYPLVAHSNGTLVTGQNPAHLGETLSIYATGLRPITSDLIGKPTPESGVPVDASTIGLGFDFNPAIDPPPSQMPIDAHPDYVGLTAGLVGTYQINVALPATAPSSARTCGGFADTNVGINLSFNGMTAIRLCVIF